MAILTLDQALAGMRPPQYMTKQTAGVPAGVLSTVWPATPAGATNATLAGVARSSSGGLVLGQIPHYDPASGDAYLGRLQIAAGQSDGAMALLLDRLWDNGGMSATSTSSQTINSAAWPARDDDDATDGRGVIIGAEMTATAGAGTPTLTLGYTNSDGTSGRSINIIGNTVNGAVITGAGIGTTWVFGYQGNDRGVRSIQTYQQSATMTSGTVRLVAFRILAMIDCGLRGRSAAIDALTGGRVRIPPGAVPYFGIVHANLGCELSGTYMETWG